MRTHTLIYAHMQLVLFLCRSSILLLATFFLTFTALLLLFKLNLKQTTEEKKAGLQSFSSRKRIELKHHICYPYRNVCHTKRDNMEEHIAT